MDYKPDVDSDGDIDIVGSDEDAAIICRDDVSNYNPDNILPESPEVMAKVRQWLSPTDYNLDSGEFHRHLASHLQGTGKWLVTKPNYQKWHDQGSDGLLWIKGIPGSGKSVFAASLTRELAKEGHPVLFFFFRQIIDANHKPVNLLRDWLDQILEYSPPLQVTLKAYADEHSPTERSIDKLSMDDLWKHLKTALAHMPRAYLVADALDEMDKGNDEFLQTLAKLGSWRPASVKVLITSRPVNTIEEPLRKISALQVRLEEHLVDMDIATYVQRGIESSAISAEDRLLVKEAVPGRANGLFLYAKLAMDSFLEPHANVRQVLRTLPADLNAMYSDLLREHARRSGVRDDIQLQILSWVTHATRPLRLLELAEFIRTTYEDSEDALLDIRHSKALVRAACGPLLEIQPDETVSVVHHSLTEFLVGSTRLQSKGLGHGNNSDHSTLVAFPILIPGPTHERLALSCLRYLLAGCLDGDLDERARRLQFPALAYSVKSWAAHVVRLDDTGYRMSCELVSSLDAFLSSSLRLDAWLNMEWGSGPTKDVTPCHVAASYGLNDYLNHIVSRTVDMAAIETGDSEEKTPLFHAASKGHATAVKILIAAGANPDADESSGLKPLHEAAVGNHATVVSALLEAGVNPLTGKTRDRPGRRCGHWRSTIGETALMYACETGHLEALEAFLPHLKEIDTVHQALSWAIGKSRSKLVKRLIQYPGIDINAEVCGSTLLYDASCRKDNESMEALIQAGADVTILSCGDSCLSGFLIWNFNGGESDRQLDAGELKYGLDLLIRAGASIDQINPHSAAENPVLLRVLLQAGGDPNIEKDGSTLLHTPHQGEEGWEVIQSLVEEGKADVNKRRSKDGKTPLLAYLSTYMPSCDVQNCIRFLEAYHPDCTLTDDKGSGPLIEAVWNWTSFSEETAELVEKLFVAGASVSQRGPGGAMAIHYATHISAIELLVKLGADINAQNDSGETILMKSLRKSRYRFVSKGVINSLIALGARIDIRDFRGRTLLHEAVHGDKLGRSGKILAGHLIDLGLDPFAVDYSGNTLLHEVALAGSNSRKSGRANDFLNLVGLGVNPNATNHAGQTPLHIVCGFKANGSGIKEPAIFDVVLKHCDVEAVDHEGTRPIHVAAKNNSEVLFFRLMSVGADICSQTYKRQTTLHLGAQADNANIVGMILSAIETGKFGDASKIIDAPDDSGNTALFYACKAGRPETVALLLRAGATKDLALDALAASGYVDLVETPVTDDHARNLAGDNGRIGVFNPPRAGMTERVLPELVMLACDREQPNMEVLRFLVERADGSIHCPDLHQAWEVTVASRAGAYTEPGSDGCETGPTALHILARGRYWWQVHQALPYLLSRIPKPDLEVRDLHCNTPLLRALDVGYYYPLSGVFHKQAVRILIQAGADVNAIGKDGYTCLSAALMDSELVSLLLANGAKVTALALFEAIKHATGEVMELLLSLGADPNMRHEEARTESKALESGNSEFKLHEIYPLFQAATSREPNRPRIAGIIRKLLHHGADPFTKFKQESKSKPGELSPYEEFTVIHEVLKRPNAVVEPFLDLLPNWNLEQRNQKGETLLLAACSNVGALTEKAKAMDPDKPEEQKLVIEILLANGADATALDNFNRNALHLAMLTVYRTHTACLPSECVKVLLASGSSKLLHQRAEHTAHMRCRSFGTKATVLHCALHVAARNSPGTRKLDENNETMRFIKILLGGGSDPLAVDGEGNTALHIMARGMEWRAASRKLFMMFLEFGIDINATNNAGETPLFFFIKGYLEPMRKSEPEAEEKIKDEDSAWVIFTENGADFEARDNEGRGLLHVLAGSYGNVYLHGHHADRWVDYGLVKFKRLMDEKGLDPMMQDENMRTSLDVAAACKGRGILALFEGDKSGNKRVRVE